MAGLIGGAILGDAISKSSTRIIEVIKKTKHFKSKLREIEEILTIISPIFNDITRLDEESDRPREVMKKFKELLEGGEDLIKKSEHIGRNLWKRYRHVLKLDRFKRSLVEFNQIYVALVTNRDVREGFMTKNGSLRGCSGVPLLHDTVIGFDNRVEDLKKLVLKDSVDDRCSVVVVSAPGGYGKTTLVTMLCNDSEIIGKFHENIYFVTISSSPNLRVVVKSLLERNKYDNQLDFASEQVAIQQWGNFLRVNTSPILLVLDDVWSHSVIKKFEFKSPGYKILVTSRTAFTQYHDNAYKLPLLNDEHASDLFRHSAFSEQLTNIPDNLVKKLVECCKNHPLALIVVGGMLKGRPLASWKILSNDLFTGNKAVWGYEEFIKLCLEKSLDHFDEPEVKKCFLDLGLFPEDQKIAGTALVDIWAHLHNHDEEGIATMDMISNLASKNLATPLQRKEHFIIDNYCEDESIMQHDMMRRVAIRLSSLGLVKDRDRIIINPDDEDFPIIQETMNARLLSISTDERSSLRWEGKKLPKVEVFVMNFMSEIHPLPKFMKNMKRLKVLIITNYGYNFPELQNFPKPKKLSSLTTIRLDHVSILSISTSILKLENLQKLSLIMCKIGNSFNESSVKFNKIWPKLGEMVIDSCDDLLEFPANLCNLVSLKKLTITNCHELTSLSESLGNLTSLKVLKLASCTKLTTLPESLRKLHKLRTLDISHCLHLCKLPLHRDELRSLQKLDASGCTGLNELPESVKELPELEVFCDKETHGLWCDLPNVKVELVEEDPLVTFLKIVPNRYQ